MIQYCPFCGHPLDPPLIDGITSCTHCNRIFDSNPTNRLLSAAWLARRRHLRCVTDLERQGFTKTEAEIVEKYVIDGGYSHQEFEKEVKNIDLDLDVNSVYS